MSSETNGNGTTDPNASGMKRILSLQQGAAPKHALTRAQRAEVECIAYDLVIQECAKVHEHYLTQIPTFVARMVQDALLSYGLIVPQPGVDIAPVVAPESPETPSGDTPLDDIIAAADGSPESVRAAFNAPIPEIVAIRDGTEPAA